MGTGDKQPVNAGRRPPGPRGADRQGQGAHPAGPVPLDVLDVLDDLAAQVEEQGEPRRDPGTPQGPAGEGTEGKGQGGEEGDQEVAPEHGALEADAVQPEPRERAGGDQSRRRTGCEREPQPGGGARCGGQGGPPRRQPACRQRPAGPVDAVDLEVPEVVEGVPGPGDQGRGQHREPDRGRRRDRLSRDRPDEHGGGGDTTVQGPEELQFRGHRHRLGRPVRLRKKGDPGAANRGGKRVGKGVFFTPGGRLFRGARKGGEFLVTIRKINSSCRFFLTVKNQGSTLTESL